jgi:fucose permease
MATSEMVTSPERARNTVVSSVTTGSYIRPLTILTTLFFMWGFLTSLNDILVPHLKSIFSLNYTQVNSILPVICYLYILFYALRGSTPNSERYAHCLEVAKRSVGHAVSR